MDAPEQLRMPAMSPRSPWGGFEMFLVVCTGLAIGYALALLGGFA